MMSNYRESGGHLNKGKLHGFVIHEDGTLRFQNRQCVPSSDGLKKKILAEAHNTHYSVHLGGTKIYRDLRQYFWGDNMKKEIVEYIDNYLTYQRDKAEHQHPIGKLRPLEILT